MTRIMDSKCIIYPRDVQERIKRASEINDRFIPEDV
jgi:hypothetical protein